MDVEFLSSVHSSQLLESLDWHPWGSCYELQESSSEFHVKLFKDLKEPDYDLVVFEVVDQIGVPPQILNIDGRPSRYHDLEFLLVEYFDEVVGDEVVEAGQEGLQLFLDTGGHLGVWGQLHILVFIFLSDEEVLAAGQ